MLAAEFLELNIILFNVDGDNLTKNDKASATGGQQDSSKEVPATSRRVPQNGVGNP